METTDTLVIGGGQAGLSVSYHLSTLGVPHVVLDAAPRIGDAWRDRWDSLRLFTPRRFDGLDGMRMPGDPDGWPTKDEMADLLAAYAERFSLPVRSGARVRDLRADAAGFVAESDAGSFRADTVVVAMSNYQVPRIPALADALDPRILQLHAGRYRSPAQLAPGPVLLVGAGNSGAEIARDIASTHEVILAGANTGEIPGDAAGFLDRRILTPLLNRVVFPHIMSVDTPIGRRARPRVMARGVPLIRVKERDLAALGVTRTGRLTEVVDGLPVADGRRLDVADIIWCTGYTAGLDWIRIPVLDERGEPRHDRGIVAEVPGLYFVGQHFLTSMASAMVHGVGRDAARIAQAVAERSQVRIAG